MAETLFRKKSLERISSPESLNDYMHVTTPSVWGILLSVALLLVGLLVWSSFASIESRAYGSAVARDGVLTVSFENEADASNVEAGMTANVGGSTTQITYVGYGATDREVILGVQEPIPDGAYDFSATYRTTRVMEMLFN